MLFQLLIFPPTTIPSSPILPLNDSILDSSNHSTAIILVSNPLVFHNTHPMLTRSKNGIFKPETYIVQSDYTSTEPTSFIVASKFPHWVEIMDSKFTSLRQQRTWLLVPLPPNKNVVGC